MARTNTARALPTEKPNPAANLKPWKPGQSGNPGGRPKGLAKRVRELVGGDGETIAQFMLDTLQNQDAEMRDRMEAAKWLADRGWGKAANHAPIEDADPLGLDQVDIAIGELVDELAQRREAKAPRPAPEREVEAAGSS